MSRSELLLREWRQTRTKSGRPKPCVFCGAVPSWYAMVGWYYSYRPQTGNGRYGPRVTTDWACPECGVKMGLTNGRLSWERESPARTSDCSG